MGMQSYGNMGNDIMETARQRSFQQAPWSGWVGGNGMGTPGYTGESFAPIGGTGPWTGGGLMGGYPPQYRGMSYNPETGWSGRGGQYPGGPTGGQYTPGSAGFSYDQMNPKMQRTWDRLMRQGTKAGLDISPYEQGIPGQAGGYNPWSGGHGGGFNYGPGWNSAAGAGGFYGQNYVSPETQEMRDQFRQMHENGMYPSKPPPGSYYDRLLSGQPANPISRQDQYHQAAQNWSTNYQDRQSKLLTDAGFTKGADGRWKNASGQEADFSQYEPNMDDIQRPGMNPAWEQENRMLGGWLDPNGPRVDRHVMTTQGDFAIPENWKPGDPIPGFDPNKMNVNQETLGPQVGGNTTAPQQPREQTWGQQLPNNPAQQQPPPVPDWLRRNQNQQQRVDNRLNRVQGKMSDMWTANAGQTELGRGDQRRYDRLLNKQTRLQDRQAGLQTKAAGYGQM